MIWRTEKTRIATWFGFVLMCLGMFMAILDTQVVATSLPTIQDALAISPDAMSWIQTAYLIAEVIAIPLTGWLTRVLTLRWLFVIAIFVFTLTSIGCAFSGNFASLVAFRVLQGFAGGMLIPAVFSGIFLLFPPRSHSIAGTIAGVMAVLGPTVGPVIGGWITHHYSWPWLFLVNVVPGIVAMVATPFLLPRGRPRLNQLKNFDAVSLALMALALACLEIGLKRAPQDGWFSAACFSLFALCAIAATLFAIRTLKAVQPVVELTTLKVRPFSIGCALSFCLGVGLFGAVYLMPVFLAYVRQHDALQIGSIMLVTGAAQLVAAPIVGALESRLDFALAVGVWLQPVRHRPRDERVRKPHRRFRRDVLAAGAARLRGDVLPAAADQDRAGDFAAQAGAGRQRAVQHDAKPRRRRRYRADRYRALRTHQRPCRRDLPAPGCRRLEGCAGNWP